MRKDNQQYEINKITLFEKNVPYVFQVVLACLILHNRARHLRLNDIREDDIAIERDDRKEQGLFVFLNVNLIMLVRCNKLISVIEIESVL